AASAAFWWHLITPATALTTFFSTFCSHFDFTLSAVRQPVSSPPNGVQAAPASGTPIPLRAMAKATLFSMVSSSFRAGSVGPSGIVVNENSHAGGKLPIAPSSLHLDHDTCGGTW